MIAMFLGPMEWGIILIVSLLIFGKRLPSVMKNLGKGIVEFKRGVQGIEDEVDKAVEEGNKPNNRYQAESSNNYQTNYKTDESPPPDKDSKTSEDKKE